MSAEVLKKEFIPKYLATGDEKFYRFLLTYALKKLVLINNGTYKGTSPDLELLDYYDRFLGSTGATTVHYSYSTAAATSYTVGFTSPTDPDNGTNSAVYEIRGQ